MFICLVYNTFFTLLAVWLRNWNGIEKMILHSFSFSFLVIHAKLLYNIPIWVSILPSIALHNIHVSISFSLYGKSLYYKFEIGTYDNECHVTLWTSIVVLLYAYYIGPYCYGFCSAVYKLLTIYPACDVH